MQKGEQMQKVIVTRHNNCPIKYYSICKCRSFRACQNGKFPKSCILRKGGVVVRLKENK